MVGNKLIHPKYVPDQKFIEIGASQAVLRDRMNL